MKKFNLVSALYKMARLANDASVLSSGNSKRIFKRARNKILGRFLGKFWKL